MNYESNQTQVELNPAFAAPGQVSIPSKWEEYVSDVPTGTKVVSYAKSIKYTPRSIQRLLQQQPIVGMYHLNVPVTEGAIYVPRYYKWLQIAAETYQRQHQDSFFEQYPQLLIVKQNEDTSTSSLRRNYRKYCKRAAHMFYHYVNTANYYTASLINLLTMSRLNGNEPFKEIAYKFRWSAINSNTTMYKGFPKPTGVENLLATSAKFSIGKSSDLSDIVCFPLYATDCFGNRGCHAVSPDSVSTMKSDGDEYSIFDEEDEELGLSYNELVKHMTDFFKYFGSYSNRHQTPGQVFIENGAMVTSVLEDETASMNLLKNGYYANTGKSDFDNLCSTLWQQFKFWDTLMRQQFMSFYDPRSDWSIIAKQMGIVQESMKPQDLLNIVRSNDGYNMSELLTKMQYKRDNHVCTATIIRYIPMYSLYDNEDNLKWDDTVTVNYDRYNIDQFNNISEYLDSTKEWPRITPTVFSSLRAEFDINAPIQPFVINAAPTAFINDTSSTSVAAPIGKIATLMDMVACSNLTPEYSFMEFVGITAEDAAKWAESCDGIVFSEAPDNIFCAVAPILDNTDIYQCGFNLMVSSNAGYQTEWDKYFKCIGDYKSPIDIEKHFDPSWDYDMVTDTAPYIPWYGLTPNSHYSMAHVANPAYLNAMKHCFIFVGAALSEPVELLWTHIETGNPYSKGFTYFAQNEEYINWTRSDADSSWYTMAAMSLFNSAEWGFIEGSYRLQLQWPGNKDISATAIESIVSRYPSNRTTYLSLFNPSYGGVRPAVMPFGVINSALYDPCNFGSYDDNARYELDTSKPLHLCLGAIMSGRVHDIGYNFRSYDPIKENIRKQIQSSIVTPQQFYLWFVQSFAQAKCCIDANGTVQAAEVAYPTATCGGTHRYNVHLMVRSKAMFTGVEDTVPFWSDDVNLKISEVMGSERVNIGTSSVVTETEVVSVQDRSFSRSNGKGHALYPKQGSLNKNEANVTIESFGNKRHQDSRKGMNRSMKNKRNSRKSEPQTNLSADKTDGINDFSSNITDTTAVKQMKVKVDPVSTQC